MLSFIIGMMLVACAGKETAPVVTEQPALGEDVAGYEGFSELTSYELSSGDTPTVIYMPRDEKAYVGNTSAITNANGVEAEVNINPLYSADIMKKSLTEKLEYTLERDYKGDKASDYRGVDVSDINEIKDGCCNASVSYLNFDETSKDYYGEWVCHNMFELEDGRVITYKIRVISTAENEKTFDTVSQIGDYLGVDLDYTPDLLSGKINGYEPDEDEAKRNESTPVEMGDLKLYVPAGFQTGRFESDVATTFAAGISGLDEKDIKIFVADDFYDNGSKQEDCDMIMIMKPRDIGISAGEIGQYNEGQLMLLADYITDGLEKEMVGAKLNGSAEKIPPIGYGIKIYGTGLKADSGETYDGAIYYIVRGNDIFMILGVTPPGSGRDADIKKTVEEVYKSAEIK